MATNVLSPHPSFRFSGIWSRIRLGDDAAFLGHNVEDYGASAGREIDESRNPAIVSFRESQHGFFYGSETVS